MAPNVLSVFRLPCAPPALVCVCVCFSCYSLLLCIFHVQRNEGEVLYCLLTCSTRALCPPFLMMMSGGMAGGLAGWAPLARRLHCPRFCTLYLLLACAIDIFFLLKLSSIRLQLVCDMKYKTCGHLPNEFVTPKLQQSANNLRLIKTIISNLAQNVGNWKSNTKCQCNDFLLSIHRVHEVSDRLTIFFN